MSWEKWAELFECKAMDLADSWRIHPPFKKAIPPPEEDAVVDAWCCRLSRAFLQPLSPPPHLREWVLARLIVAAAMAKSRFADGNAHPLAFTADSIEWLLCDEWAVSTRRQWEKFQDFMS